LNYLEPWEKDSIKQKLKLNEFKLVSKYSDMLLFDDEEEITLRILPTGLEWKKKDKLNKETPCYVVVAKPVDDEEDDDENIAAYHINDALHDMIAAAKHPNYFVFVGPPALPPPLILARPNAGLNDGDFLLDGDFEVDPTTSQLQTTRRGKRAAQPEASESDSDDELDVATAAATAAAAKKSKRKKQPIQNRARKK
jgi:hypothetical protein